MKYDRSSDLRSKLLKVHYQAVPNWLAVDYIFPSGQFKEYTQKEILDCLETLTTEKVLEKDERHPDVETTKLAHRVRNIENIPYETHIEFGSVKVPRLLGNDRIRAEDINQSLLALSAVSEDLVKDVKHEFKEQMQSYWVNQISIFGVFVAVFSMITISTPRLLYETNLIGWDRLFHNLADLSPLAVVLGLFILLLKIIIR